MSRYTTGEITERLEALRAAAGADCDWATDVLDLVERADASDDLLCKMIAGEKTGDSDCDAIISQLAEHEALGKLLDEDELAGGFAGDNLVERLQALIDFVVEQERQVMALQELAVTAGLLDAKDFTTDPLPLIAMFLPAA